MENHVLVSKECLAEYKDGEIGYFIAPEIACGFPSPATDSLEVRLSITDFFTSNPTATFFGRAVGTSLEGIGISDGDILVIDRSLRPMSNDIIVMTYDGGFTAKKVFQNGKQVFLISENPNYPPLEVTDPDNLVVWGVVSKVIKDPRSGIKNRYGHIRKVI
ncbi:LexA family protein [Pedobacter antarcticus]|uniref:LexA family protein n=1 Tax=Pedobacter antarcticus TaxID=34086 RepID=UPI000888AA2B|nr:translesion error-prone DNA polymerase V autoproteolytic subunit [Pedobacter antarcticus]SDM84025.1 DNA polymerase V [Pedobacter antarcticus]